MDLTLVILFLFCMGAAIVQRVSGFGFGIFIMTALPYLMPTYGECTALSGLLAMVTSAIITFRLRRFVNWRKFLPILVTFIIVSFFAVQFVAAAADVLLKRILGVTLILASVWFLFVSGRFTLRPSLPVQVSMGTLSGIMGGLFGMQGPPAVLYFISATKSKEEYMAIAQCYFLCGNLMMTLFRAQSGFLTMNVARAWCIGVAAVLIGTMIGSALFRRISLPLLRRIIYAYMAVSGAIALVG